MIATNVIKQCWYPFWSRSYVCYCYYETFCYIAILPNANCHDGQQILILESSVALSRNILGQDARSRVLRPTKPFSLQLILSVQETPAVQHSSNCNCAGFSIAVFHVFLQAFSRKKSKGQTAWQQVIVCHHV
jgi:hypothetical protein